MTHASLFSGIGGAEIAATWMGWNNAFHCEINPFGRKVLEYWYPNSESYEDITKTDFSEWRGRVDVLTAGFPCQPFSVAGQRKGADDDRYLWPQVVRAVHEIRPAWVVGENVAGILTMVQPGEEVEVGSGSALFGENHLYRAEQQYVLETVCQDLESEGYSVQPFVILACAVGAPHRRDRVWFIARRVASHPDLNRQRERSNQQIPLIERQGTPHDSPCGQDGVTTYPDEHRSTPRTTGAGTEGSRRPDLPQPGERRDTTQRPDGLHGLPWDVINTFGIRWNEGELHDGKFAQSQQTECREKQSFGTDCPQDWWRDFPTQSPVCGRDDEFSARLVDITFPRWRQESIKALGNAWVPQVAYELFRAIQQTEYEEATHP